MRLGRTRDLLVTIASVSIAFLGLTVAHDASAQRASGAPYKIGVTYPLSGPQGAWGQITLPALEIAVQHVNESGGVNGRPLALVVEDSKGNPEGGISAMRKVVQVDGAAVILSLFTNVVSAQMPLADQFKVALITAAESPGLVAKSNWAFQHSPVLTRTLPLLSARWQREKVKRLFAFYPNTPLAKYISPAVKAESERLGVQYEEALFKLGDTDFRGIVARAKTFNPEAIFIFGHGTPDEGVLMKQIRELGMNTQIYSGCGCITAKSYREAAGKTAEGMIYAGFKYDPAAARKLIAPYRAKLGFDPDYNSLEAYDMVYMVVNAIKQYGYSGDGIRRSLSELKDFPSIGGGLVSMGKDRQSLVSVALYQVKDVTKPEFVEIKP